MANQRNQRIPRQPDSKRSYRAYADKLGELLRWLASHQDVLLASNRSEPYSSTESSLIRAMRLGWDGITRVDADRIIQAFLGDSAQSVSYYVEQFKTAQSSTYAHDTLVSLETDPNLTDPDEEGETDILP